MKKSVAVLSIASILTMGCASSPKQGPYFSPDNGVRDEEQFLIDRRVCQERSGYDPKGYVLFGPLLFVAVASVAGGIASQYGRTEFIECMKEKGYTYHEPEYWNRNVDRTED